MIKAYTYLLHCIPLNKWYYGVRWKKNCNPNDFWNTYFTSSEHIKNLIKKFGKESFEFEIRKTFDDVNKARNWEHKVLRRLRVLQKTNIWLNRTDNKSIDPTAALKGTVGSRWINNGTINKKISSKEQPTIGWEYGRIAPYLQKNRGRKPVGKYQWSDEQKIALSLKLKNQYENGRRPWNKT